MHKNRLQLVFKGVTSVREIIEDKGKIRHLSLYCSNLNAESHLLLERQRRRRKSRKKSRIAGFVKIVLSDRRKWRQNGLVAVIKGVHGNDRRQVNGACTHSTTAISRRRHQSSRHRSQGKLQQLATERFVVHARSSADTSHVAHRALSLSASDFHNNVFRLRYSRICAEKGR